MVTQRFRLMKRTAGVLLTQRSKSMPSSHRKIWSKNLLFCLSWSFSRVLIFWSESRRCLVEDVGNNGEGQTRIEQTACFHHSTSFLPSTTSPQIGSLSNSSSWLWEDYKCDMRTYKHYHNFDLNITMLNDFDRIGYWWRTLFRSGDISELFNVEAWKS